MGHLSRLLLIAAASAVAAAPSASSNKFTIEVAQQAQVILGVGYEIQSDSIGSGNNGLPESNSSVPNDLVQSEKDRFFSEMLQGFRFCRLAMGLYFRGLTPDSKHIVERWEGQAAGLAEMAHKSGIEGFEVEYWSPPPGWKSTNNYIDGTLTGFDAQTLDAFSDAVVVDAQYLQSNGIHPVWWGLQNEPPVGPNGCTYSCCGYDAHGYYLAFNATASKIRTAFPDVVIHASSWSGQYLSPEISADPAALALVDAWTFHRVGADSNDQMQNQDYFLKGAAGKAVLNNEFEYLDDYTDAYRTINTAQSIMNWMVFENSPTWFWLHALKPLGHAEASGYGLGYWQPWNTSEAPSTVASDEAGTAGHAVVAEGALSSSPVLPGYWIFEPRNWNAMAGFTKYMPWDSVRVNVTEETVLEDVRILAYLYSPSMARWLQPDFVQPRVEPGSSGRTLRDDATARAAATKLGFVVTNRYNTTSVDVTVDISGIDTSAGLPTFDGYLYNPNATDVSLGSVTAQTNTSTGLPYLALTLQPTTIQFWVQQ